MFSRSNLGGTVHSASTSRDTSALPQVLLVSHGFGSNYERGFCNGLQDAGCKFMLISSDQTDYAGLRAGVNTLNLRGSQLSNRPRWRKAANMLRYHLALMLHVARHRPQVLHVIGLIHPPFLCGVIQGLWFRLWCNRYFLTVHDTEPHDRGTGWNRMLYSWAFRVAPYLVVHTTRLRDELVNQHGILSDRITAVEHGLEPLVEAVELPGPGRQPQPLRLLVFGSVMRYKGVDLLLEALREFPCPTVLTIAGRCMNATLETELRAQIAAHPLARAIHWENIFVPEEAIPGLFTEADALVLAYRRIDQSGVLFQAFRFGLPVVATRVGAFADYVNEPMGECCEPADPASLRMALLRVVERYPAIDRAQLRLAGRRFEWQRTVQVLTVAYAA